MPGCQRPEGFSEWIWARGLASPLLSDGNFPCHAGLGREELVQDCFYSLQGWWSHQLCLGRQLTQFHLEEGTNRPNPIIVLGRYDTQARPPRPCAPEHTVTQLQAPLGAIWWGRPTRQGVAHRDLPPAHAQDQSCSHRCNRCNRGIGLLTSHGRSQSQAQLVHCMSRRQPGSSFVLLCDTRHTLNCVQKSQGLCAMHWSAGEGRVWDSRDNAETSVNPSELQVLCPAVPGVTGGHGRGGQGWGVATRAAAAGDAALEGGLQGDSIHWGRCL